MPGKDSWLPPRRWRLRKIAFIIWKRSWKLYLSVSFWPITKGEFFMGTAWWKSWSAIPFCTRTTSIPTANGFPSMRMGAASKATNTRCRESYAMARSGPKWTFITSEAMARAFGCGLLAGRYSAAKGSGVSPELTLNYADGTKQKQKVFFPNWFQPSNLGGAVLSVSSQGRNNANGPSPEYTQYKYQVFSNSLPLLPGKSLVSVTLPITSNVKFFDWQLVTQKLLAAPDK